MGRPGSALGNAVIESWHSTVEFELRRAEHFATRAAARAKVAAWIEDYNTRRRHSACQMMPPARYEQALTAGGGSPDMPAPLPPSTIGRCPASSRSFPRGPDGPARAPPGQDLRSGALIGLPENREQNKIRITRSPRFEGNPGSRRAGDGSCPRRRCLIAARRAVSLAELLLPAAGGSGGGTAGYGFQPGWRVRAGGGTVSVPLILFTRRVRAAVSALACSLLPWTCCARAGPGG
jgi:hypothetical protein